VVPRSSCGKEGRNTKAEHWRRGPYDRLARHVVEVDRGGQERTARTRQPPRPAYDVYGALWTKGQQLRDTANREEQDDTIMIIPSRALGIAICDAGTVASAAAAMK
jgi:hypothetical protein